MPTRMKEKNGKKIDILDAAAKLFAEKGYNETTLSEIAAVVGVSQPALYYYFRCKLDILSDLSMDCSVSLYERLKPCFRTDLPPAEKMRLVLFEWVSHFAKNTKILSVLSRERRNLPRDTFDVISKAERQILDELEKIVRQGVASGDFEHRPSRVVALALAGACNSIIFWYKPEGGLGPDELAEVFAQLLINGCVNPRLAEAGQEG